MALRCASPATNRDSVNKATPADIWAIALSEDGQYLAGVTQDGHIKVWDLAANGEEIRDYETKGSFGTCIDLVRSVLYLPLLGWYSCDKISLRTVAL